MLQGSSRLLGHGSDTIGHTKLMISFVGPPLPILAIRGADDGERLWDGKKDRFN